MAARAQDETPTQTSMDAAKMEVAADSAAVYSLPLQAKLSHLLALVVTGVIALMVSATLADGSSVIELKPVRDLPRLTDPKYIPMGLDYRADELLGPTYGVGLHHDASGYSWAEAGAGPTLQTYIQDLGVLQVIAAVPSVIATDGLKHPVHFLSCESLKHAGQSAMGLAIIAEVVAALMIAFHGTALVGLAGGQLRAKYAKAFAALVWFVLTAGFLTVICIAHGIMETRWECDNDFIPSVKISEHFQFKYGLVFGYLGYSCALLVLMVLLVFTSTTDGVARPGNARYSAATTGAVTEGKMNMAVAKVLGGFVTGMLVLGICVIAVAGSLGAFDGSTAFPDRDGDVNYCQGQKPIHAGPGDKYFKNVQCMKDGLVQVLEQSGANVTKGFYGLLDTGDSGSITERKPITERYSNTDLCPVNVHWHLGAEHLSVGQYDEYGDGPEDGGNNNTGNEGTRRRLASSDGNYTSSNASDQRLGFRCHHYNASNSMFTEPYDWKHCSQMMVGETYEVHWPHSAAGACGTKWQYQTPFYDGVFCNDGIINILTPLNTYENIGVQAQVFTIVNDGQGAASPYHIPNLIDGMIYDDKMGVDITKYTGSTTGTTRNNEMCSRYAPITWQVDRNCHLVSALSFDLMCKAMKAKADDMSDDTHPHGSRELVDRRFVADNQEFRRA